MLPREDGFENWYSLISQQYVSKWGLSTVDQIIPVYAPAADHNNESAYIQSVKKAVDTWRSGGLVVSSLLTTKALPAMTGSAFFFVLSLLTRRLHIPTCNRLVPLLSRRTPGYMHIDVPTTRR